VGAEDTRLSLTKSQRVCILKVLSVCEWLMVKDEPVKDLLGNINKALIQRLLKCKYDVTVCSPYRLLASRVRLSELSLALSTRSWYLVTFKLGSKLPETKAGFMIWLARSSTGFSPYFFLQLFQSIICDNAYAASRTSGGQKVLSVCGSLLYRSLYYGALDPT